MEFSDRNNDRNDRNFEQPDDGELEEPCLDGQGLIAVGPDRPDVDDNQPPVDAISGEDIAHRSPEETDLADIEKDIGDVIDDRCEALLQRLRDGEDITGDEDVNVGLGLRVRVHREAANGNIDAVDDCIRTLSSIRRATGKLLADSLHGDGPLICAEATVLGSRIAADELYKALAREKHAQANASTSSDLAVYRQISLKTTVEVFARSGFRAEHLIDRYAPDQALKIAHYAAYIKQCIERDEPPERIHQLETAVADTYMLLPDNVAANLCGYPLLSVLLDDNVRMAVLERFQAANREVYNATGRPTGRRQYAEILDGILITPPSTMTPQNRKIVRDFAMLSDRDKTEGYSSMKIDAAIARGATPGEAVDLARRLAAVDELGLGDNVKGSALLARIDRVFRKYAARYARVGDFEAAQTFLESMTGAYETARAASGCMLFASTARQRLHIRGSPLQQLTHPELDYTWRAMDAVQRSDMEQLESSLLSMVAPKTLPYSSPSDEIAAKYDPERDSKVMGYALRNIPPEHASRIARRLQIESSLYAESPVGKWDARVESIQLRLSRILVRLGDTQEIRRLYREASNEDRSPFSRESSYETLATLRFILPLDR